MEQKKNRRCQLLFSVLISLLLFAVVEGRKPRNNNASRKIIKTREGDVYNCVDLNKQPSLLHPALKDHKVQEKGYKTSQAMSVGLHDGCPPGSVPIFTRMPKIISSKVASGYDPHAQFAGLVTKQTVPRLHPIYGSYAAYNIHWPQTGPTQRSSSVLALESTVFGHLSRVEAGWMVNPGLFGDGKTRLYVGWVEGNETTENGCYNTICNGFITTSSSVPLGYEFPLISEPKGRQYDVSLEIALRQGRWELHVNGESVGYWPSEIVPNLNPYTLTARWGGEVLKPDTSDAIKPEMGNGGFNPDWGFTFNAYVRQIILRHSEEEDTWKVPRKDEVDVFWSNCYRATLDEYRPDRDLGYSFVYGGKDGVFGVDC